MVTAFDLIKTNVTTTTTIESQKSTNLKAMPKLTYNKLQNDLICRQTCVDVVKNKYKNLEVISNSKRNTLTEALVTMTKEVFLWEERQEKVMVDR